MFKVHRVGQRRLHIVEWDQELMIPGNLAYETFLAWCAGRLVPFMQGMAIFNDEEDFTDFIDYAHQWGWVREEERNREENETFPERKSNNRGYSPESIVEFVKKNPNCTFTQIKNATGLEMSKLRGLIDRYVKTAAITKTKKGSQFFYST